MEQLHTIFNNSLLVFQVCLGLWQIGKLTPVGGLVQGGIGWFLSLLPFGAFLSPTYALLRRFPGRVFKQLHGAVLKKSNDSQKDLFPVLDDLIRAKLKEQYMGSDGEIAISYLGDKHTLKRRDGNKLFVDDKMSYYITDAIWINLLMMLILSADNEVEHEYVYLRGYQEFWKFVVTGGVMKFPEVLDGIILDNLTTMLSDNDWVLPVNLSLSEEKVLKVLNLVGLFLQTKKVFWLIPTLLSFVSAMLEFNTTLRSWLYTKINKVFCWSMHLVCDRLSYSKRRQVYSLGKWVENLKPSNDLQLKVVKGDIRAVIAGGAKVDKEHATLVDWLHLQEGETEKSFCKIGYTFYCEFLQDINRCLVALKYHDDDDADVVTVVDCNHHDAADDDAHVVTDVVTVVDCNHHDAADDDAHVVTDVVTVVDCKSREEYMEICTLVDCIAKSRSGSLKSCDSKTNKVQVNGWKDSLRHYVKSGCPPIYELKLECVTVVS